MKYLACWLWKGSLPLNQLTRPIFHSDLCTHLFLALIWIMTLEPEGDYTHVNVSPEGPRLTQGILTENLCQNPHHAMRLHCQNPLLKDYISTICNVRMMLEIIAVIRVPCIVRQTPVIIAVIRVPCIGRQTPVIILWVTRGGGGQDSL